MAAYESFGYVARFVDELARLGLRHVCYCPGSRSTPLALLFAEHPRVRMWSHLDERSASYFALGMAKMLGEPVAVFCTSGTAAANFHPAVSEAFYGRVPLIVLTADRPHEAQDIGAPQTIDQLKLFGDHVKWFAEMPVNDASKDLERYACRAAARAFVEAVGSPPGPVHLNFPFREPLIPDLDKVDWRTETGMTEASAVDASPRGGADIRAVASGLANRALLARRGLLVCGPMDGPGPVDSRFAAAVTSFAQAVGFPILADPLSQLRTGDHDRSQVIDAYDAILRDEAFQEANRPDFVIRTGQAPTSKPLTLYLKSCDVPQTVIDPHGFRDALLSASQVVSGDPARIFAEALKAIAPPPRREASRPGGDAALWLEGWRTANQRARRAIDETIAGFNDLFEGRVFAELRELLPDGAALFAGSSMPVRDLDSFFAVRERRVRFVSNRGANGIDGVVSSALGAAAVSEEPLVLVLGDLSFYHDMNGLLAAKRHNIDATIVLINNDGGGIFSFLPQAEPVDRRIDHFEALFGTPHGLDFQGVSRTYGVHYQVASTWEDFRFAVRSSIEAASPGSGVRIVEVRTDRKRNAELHREIWRRVSQALRSAADDGVSGLPGIGETK